MFDETKPDRIWMVCAVCGYPLERTDNPAFFEGREWGHVRPSDHEAAPVDPTTITVNQRCDFCDREQATDLVLAHSFVMPHSESRSIGHWAACEQCAEMVQRKRWGQLVTHVKRSGGPVSARAPRRVLQDIYASVEKNMYGVMSLKQWHARATYPLPTEAEFPFPEDE